ncbi:MAG: hypothetical protein ACRD10_03340 [Terriglobia bacterium]
MDNISLRQSAQLLGSNAVSGMAQQVGLQWPPPPPISVRNLDQLARQPILPLAPIDLQPQNGASGISSGPNLFFIDPGAGTRAAVSQFGFTVSQNNILVDPSHTLTGPTSTSSPLTPPGIKWGFPLPPGEVTLTVWGVNAAGTGPASTSAFTVSSPPPPPPLTPPNISVASSGHGTTSQFTVTGSGFKANSTVTIYVRDDAYNTRTFKHSADSKGQLNAPLPFSCGSGASLHFSATDSTPDPQNLVTGVLMSNTFTVPCP